MPSAARDIPFGEDWAFREHRTLAEVGDRRRYARPDTARRMTIAVAKSRLLARTPDQARAKILDTIVLDTDFDDFEICR